MPDHLKHTVLIVADEQYKLILTKNQATIELDKSYIFTVKPMQCGPNANSHWRVRALYGILFDAAVNLGIVHQWISIIAMTESGALTLPEKITAEFAALPEVTAVVLAGSKGGRFSDGRSDIDLYVYADTEPLEAWRTGLARKFGERASIGNHFWESGDELVTLQAGVVDIMYRSPAWIEEQIDRVLLRHQASVGYSTCFVHNVLYSKPLYDRDGWFASLRAKAGQPYPEALRRNIIAKNHPVLRSTLSSYVHQIALAIARGDHVSVNHRITALLASYFDILFAVNRLPHPGEKRLVAYVLETCPKYPPDLQMQLNEVLLAAAPTGHADVLGRVNELLDGLDALLVAEGLIAR